MFALVQPNKIVAQVEINTFPMHSDFQWIECDETVKSGYTWDGKVFSPPEIVIIPPAGPTEDDEFRIAVKTIIPAITEFISGTLTKEGLLAVYNDVEPVIGTINEKVVG